MSILESLSGPGADLDPHAWLARSNPVAKIAAASVIGVALLLTVDAVTAAVMLALELAVLPWTGLPLGAVLRRARPVLFAAVPAGIVTALLGVDSGRALGLSISTGSAIAGLAITLRICAIGLPGVVLLATTDPADLAGALAQNLRLPPRFVLSALAAMRLAGVLGEQWQSLALARRARGLRSNVARQLFALLVLAIRQGTTLATAMEARGFGVQQHRTWARRSTFGAHDVTVVIGAVLLAALATAAGVTAGTWNLVLG